jgi:hypothetical protein
MEDTQKEVCIGTIRAVLAKARLGALGSTGARLRFLGPPASDLAPGLPARKGIVMRLMEVQSYIADLGKAYVQHVNNITEGRDATMHIQEVGGQGTLGRIGVDGRALALLGATGLGLGAGCSLTSPTLARPTSST